MAIGSANMTEYVTGSGTADNGSGGIQSLNYDNHSFYRHGYQLLTSSDSGNTWQFLDNQTFSNPRGITFSQ